MFTQAEGSARFHGEEGLSYRPELVKRQRLPLADVNLADRECGGKLKWDGRKFGPVRSNWEHSNAKQKYRGKP